MQFRLPVTLVLICSLNACSGSGVGGSMSPQTLSTKSLAVTSAVRAPANVLAAARKRQELGASPYPISAVAWPISAVAWPISAVAWPISAVAWPGAPSAPTVDACSDVSGGSNTNDAAARGSLKSDKGGSKDVAKCKAQINTGIPINPDPHAPPSAIGGLQPGLLRYIYNIPDGGGDGQTVALVVAHDNPQAEADLAVYRSTFGLPPCTSANGCFKKIAGSGSALPAADAGWSIESSLDLDAVSAACPHCKVLLVEAATNLIPDLGAAVDKAVASGASVVSNSYGAVEAADNVQFASHFDHPGVPITAAAGDLGYGVQFPASVPSVTAVGGTIALQIADGGIAEVVWPLTSGGCSAFFAKPTWQHDTGCAGRTTNDVAMLADPSDGIAVYDSTLPGTAHGGWSAIGGTSLGAPLIAALYVLAAKGGRLGSNADIYAAAASSASKEPLLLNITSGSNGTCAVTYLCNGVVGYNAPTGNGVPWGVGAFAPTK